MWIIQHLFLLTWFVKKWVVNAFYRHEGYLFRFGRLSIPNGSIRELLVREAHGGGLAGHFGKKKTLELLKEHFYWLGMIRDVHRVLEKCVACKKAKSKEATHGIYVPLLILNQPWVDVSMDFVLGQ